MSKLGDYLQEHLLGEVSSSVKARRSVATDGSFLAIAPSLVVKPKTEEDVRKTASFCWQLAERGQAISITPRGSGSSLTGGAIGSGIILKTQDWLDRAEIIDAKKKRIVVEPGVSFSELEKMLNSHGLSLPVQPDSPSSTLGGAIGNNASGKKSVKYGSIKNYVKGLRVVLSNGEVIETRPLSKRELSKKMGQSTFEGEIYRSVDKLIEENSQALSNSKVRFGFSANSAGYNIFDVKRKGHFDLTPLFIGSQGTLGIITEAEIEVMPVGLDSVTCLVALPELGMIAQLVDQILKLKPSMCEFINREAVELVQKTNETFLKNIVDNFSASAYLVVEFDEFSDSDRKKALKHLAKITDSFGCSLKVATDEEAELEIMKLIESLTVVIDNAKSHELALAIAPDACVPVNLVGDFFGKVSSEFSALGLLPAAWGHIGIGNIRFQATLDLAKLGDRQKLFKLLESTASSALSLGGTISSFAGDGRVKSPYLTAQYGHELYALMAKLKHIFDSHNILNDGVKTSNIDQIKESILPS